MSALASLVRAYEPLVARDEVPPFGYSSERIGFLIPLEEDGTIHVHARDTDDHWYLTIGRRSIRRADPGQPVSLTLTGTASDLYLALWNRGDDAAISASGDRQLLDTWHTYTGVRWDLA